MIGFELHYEIRLLTGVQIRTGYGHQHLNQVIVRDAKDQLILPGSSLKGRMRYCTTLFDGILSGRARLGTPDDPTAPLIQEMFGSRQNKGTLLFEVGRLKPEFQSARMRFGEERTGIHIMRSIGSVKGHHLRFYEASPRGLEFESQIEGSLSENQPRNISDELHYLLGAMRLFNKLGADKTRGNGSVQVQPTKLIWVNSNEKEWSERDLRLSLEDYVSIKLGT